MHPITIVSGQDDREEVSMCPKSKSLKKQTPISSYHAVITCILALV